MNLIPLNFAIFGTCINPEGEKGFDVNVAYCIARRRLRPEAKRHLTGVLSAILPSGKSHPTSWKFAFKDKNIGSGESQRIVLVHEKYSSKHKASRNDFKDCINATSPTGENQIPEIPPLPTNRPANAPYQFELIATTNHKPRWVIHTVKN